MKIASLRCACTPGPLPIDHYHNGACRKPPMPLPRINGILASIQGDTTHQGGRITATRVLTCARQVIIEDSIPTPFDVLSYNSIYDGVIEHEAMQRHAPPGTYTEVRLPLPGQEPPRLFGVPIEGTIDFLTADLREIHDYKKHSETAQKFKFQRGGADQELAAQLNIYRLLLEQCLPEAHVERLVVWHGAMTSAGGPPPWFRVELPLMTEEEIAEIRPNGGDYAVRQIVAEYVKFSRGAALPTDAEVGLAGTEPPPSEESALEAAIRRVPLMGRKMWGGKKCVSYCAVKDICDRIEGITRL